MKLIETSFLTVTAQCPTEGTVRSWSSFKVENYGENVSLSLDKSSGMHKSRLLCANWLITVQKGRTCTWVIQTWAREGVKEPAPSSCLQLLLPPPVDSGWPRLTEWEKQLRGLCHLLLLHQ